MDEKILKELKEVKDSQGQKDNRIIQMLSIIEGRLYSIEESITWLKNGGKHIGDAAGPAGVPGV